jgi:uncharacterized SAM-binding protein YcdF (DUF218 family)
MILKSKYVFESKSTRMKRYFYSVLIILASVFGLYSFVCGIILLDARSESKAAKAAFIQNPPDLIVVFTGDKGRIKYAVDKAKELKQPNVFISGVHQKNSVQTLINPIDPSLSEADHFELDYNARNTVENVVQTYKYLRANRALHKILIISSDYHIMRIKQILHSLKTEDDKFEFYFSPVHSSYFDFRNIKLLYTEVFKILRTKIFLTFWDHKAPLPYTY